MAQIDNNERNRLNRLSRDEIKTLDPSSILDALRLDYKVEKNGTEYVFTVRAENTPSARFKLFRDGMWAYKDFGDSSFKGSVIKLVEQYAGMTFQDAMSFIYDNMPDSKNYYAEALELEKLMKHNYSFDYDKKMRELEEKREQNQIVAEKYSNDSRVTKAYSIFSSNQYANDFLRNRGLDKTPPFIMSIQGEYDKLVEKGNEEEIETVTTRGIGVLCGDIKQHLLDIKNKAGIPEDVGADMHYYKAFYNEKTGKTLKTQSLGAKNFTYWLTNKPENKDKILIFESKFDASALYCHNPQIWEKYNVIIANGVNTADNIGLFIKEQGFKEIINYSQNDYAAMKFAEDILKIQDESFDKEKNYSYIQYGKNEVGMDINDLYKDGIYSDNRLKTGYTKQINRFLRLIIEKRDECKSKLKNDYKEDMKKIDTVILSNFNNLKNDETAKSKLTSDEYKRYLVLNEKGYLRDLKKREVFKNNLGVSIDELMLLKEISDIDSQIDKMKNFTSEKGFNVSANKISFNNKEELKNILKGIDISDADEIEQLEEINDILDSKKDKESYSSVFEEWIKEVCESNTKDTIDSLKMYTVDIEDTLGVEFTYINIGSKLVKTEKENVNEKKVDTVSLVVSADAFEPDESQRLTGIEENENIEEEIEEEIAKSIESQKTEPQKAPVTPIAQAVNTKTSTIKPESVPKKPTVEAVKKQTAETVIKKTAETTKIKEIANNLQNNVLSVEDELDAYEITVNKHKEYLIKTVETASKSKGNDADSIEVRKNVKETTESIKTANNTIIYRLKNEEFKNSIGLKDKDVAEKLEERRKSIGGIALKNLTIAKNIEENLASDKAIPNKMANIVATKNSKEIIEILAKMCDEIDSMVATLESAVERLKKLSNDIDKAVEDNLDVLEEDTGRHP